MPKFQKLGPSEGFDACDEIQNKATRVKCRALELMRILRPSCNPYNPRRIFERTSVLQLSIAYCQDGMTTLSEGQMINGTAMM